LVDQEVLEILGLLSIQVDPEIIRINSYYISKKNTKLTSVPANFTVPGIPGGPGEPGQPY
jgi:hypothetical protein